MGLKAEYAQRTTNTATCETSAARAPIRALAEYLSSIEFAESVNGSSKLAVSSDGKADPESLADYPAAAIFIDGPIRYVEEGSVEPVTGAAVDSGQLILMGEVQASVLVHVWTNEDEHREIVLRALEDAFSPVEWMSGFELEMPHYYNCVASYQLVEITFEDSPDDVQRRYRKVTLQLMVKSPYARLFSLPTIKPRFQSEVS